MGLGVAENGRDVRDTQISPHLHKKGFISDIFLFFAFYKNAVGR